MEKNRLPDTPWHVGFAKKKDEDPRRHKARCIHIDLDGKCKCSKAGAYPGKCCGSSHCIFYAETWGQWETVKANTQTVEEEAAERIERYKVSLRKKRKKLIEDLTAAVHYVNLDKITKCAVCDEKLRKKMRQCIVSFVVLIISMKNKLRSAKVLIKPKMTN